MKLPSPNQDLSKRLASADGDEVRSAILAYLVEAGLDTQKGLDKERDEISMRWAQGRKQFIIEFAEVIQKAGAK